MARLQLVARPLGGSSRGGHFSVLLSSQRHHRGRKPTRSGSCIRRLTTSTRHASDKLRHMEFGLVLGLISMAAAAFVMLEHGRKQRAKEADEGTALTTAVGQVLEQWTTERLPAGGVVYNLDEIDPRPLGIRLVRGEILHAFADAKRYEYKRDGRFAVGAVRVSVPIIKGVRLQSYRGRAHAPKSWVGADEGRLFVTDRSIIFDGRTRNLRTTLGQILKFDWGPDGITIEPKRGAIQRYELDVDPKFAAALLVVMAEPAEAPSDPSTQPTSVPEPAVTDDALRTDADGVKIYEID